MIRAFKDETKVNTSAKDWIFLFDRIIDSSILYWKEYFFCSCIDMSNLEEGRFIKKDTSRLIDSHVGPLVIESLRRLEFNES